MKTGEITVITSDEKDKIRYALNELANRRQEQGIDMQEESLAVEARELRELARRISQSDSFKVLDVWSVS